MKSKKEVIEEAWGDSKIGYSKETGWAVTYCVNGIDDFTTEMQERFDFEYLEQDLIKFRPKSLLGIEDNNGWTKIESEEDLPKEGHIYWTLRKGFTYPMYVIVGDEGINQKYWLDNYSHYQPIQKPNAPIY